MRFGASDIEPIVAEIGAQAKVLQIIHAALVVGVLEPIRKPKLNKCYCKKVNPSRKRELPHFTIPGWVYHGRFNKL
jgi:hypothetical protein